MSRKKAKHNPTPCPGRVWGRLFSVLHERFWLRMEFTPTSIAVLFLGTALWRMYFCLLCMMPLIDVVNFPVSADQVLGGGFLGHLVWGATVPCANVTKCLWTEPSAGFGSSGMLFLLCVTFSLLFALLVIPRFKKGFPKPAFPDCLIWFLGTVFLLGMFLHMVASLYMLELAGPHDRLFW